ncbi:MAG: carboxypeptidase-like regulatory domain-containing protein, partial [Saprospiraceae bacterium]
MNRLVTMLCLGILFVDSSFAQRIITGKITNSEGEPLIGANILVKDTSIGTIADEDGMYRLDIPASATTMVVSYTGFDTREITLGTDNLVDVGLTEGLLMEEILITAFGIDRNARDISYSNQTVKSEELLSTPNKNALEALRGKVAGVRISEGSGSVGASTKIVFRGEGSLTGNNNALIVIDGIPIDNAASRSG